MKTREEVLQYGLTFPNTYAAVIPGYHQNKEHWNTVILDGSVPENEIKRMIAESYDLVTVKGRKSRRQSYIIN